ncbi:ubiquitin carboxyl-terminal hydrolase 20 isoform X2 [Sitophilus oryzae]|uniref:Ubiquitin carboxyl-terminal hydrolase n=1 Tax=Sitophilus oryzae TaxID=7048 RepID=A0A6J2XPB8_SITOR|nr:ubiquitin carboxyl-terminal hydrolase 20 isoform X2 [Sitophilus oryzae]
MKQCSHLEESVNDLNEIANILTARECWSELKCSDCDCHGPNLWLCLKKNCSHIGCAEKSNDHSTIHNAMDSTHCIHMNLSTRRVWCYKCKGEVFLGSNGMVNTTVYENNQDEKDTSSNRDTNHGSYSPLRANSPDRGTIFEDSVGLNVGMSGEGDASDSSDVGESIDYNSTTSNGGLVGLQNIGNTCYMNAALQALSNTEPLTKYFLDCGQIVHWLSEGKKPGLSRTFQALLRDMWLKKTSQSFVNPSGILYGIRNVYAMFRGYHQHDTQEFLRNFMDQLHEELKQPVAAECGGPACEGDTFSLAIEEPPTLSYDSSEGEYETCDSGVSERSSLSDDSETRPGTETAVSGGKRRLSECQSPARRQRPRVVASPVIDAQPQSTSARKPVKYRSIISDIFDGKLLSSVQCLTCDRVSSRVETFQDLSLPIPSKDHLVLLHGRASVPSATCTDAVAAPAQDGWLSWLLAWLRSWWYGPAVTLHDCLAAFFSTDELKGDNMYSCERCNKLRNGVKYSKVLQLPEVLCVHLKRFRHELMYSSKIAAAVSFPLRDLDMWPYLQDDQPRPKVPNPACDRDTTKPSTYDLFSVICHHGTAGGGHYTSFALNGGQWYEFDDQYVTRVSAERVQNCEAYVLFYRKSQAAAEGVRRQASRLADEGAPKARLSRQWLARFRHCAEPGPIDNSDFLCRHGALDPDKEPLLERLAVRVPLEMYEYLQERFGGSAPPEDSACPACTALQHRVLREMEQFLEVSREAQAKRPPHTHYLSTGWYLRWLAFVQRKVADPPGPVDNGASEEEKADVPETVWRFFHGIYGGGPEFRVPPREADREGESDGEERPERGPAQGNRRKMLYRAFLKSGLTLYERSKVFEYVNRSRFTS